MQIAAIPRLAALFCNTFNKCKTILAPLAPIGCPTATAPTLVPNRGSTTTGIGGVSAECTIVINGVNRFNVTGANLVVTSLPLQGSNANAYELADVSATATAASLRPDRSDTNTGIGHNAPDQVSIVTGGLEAARFEDPADLAAGETSLHVFDDDNNTLEQVTVGAADSGGLGFKVLRIPN